MWLIIRKNVKVWFSQLLIRWSFAFDVSLICICCLSKDTGWCFLFFPPRTILGEDHCEGGWLFRDPDILKGFRYSNMDNNMDWRALNKDTMIKMSRFKTSSTLHWESTLLRSCSVIHFYGFSLLEKWWFLLWSKYIETSDVFFFRGCLGILVLGRERSSGRCDGSTSLNLDTVLILFTEVSHVFVKVISLH